MLQIIPENTHFDSNVRALSDDLSTLDALIWGLLNYPESGINKLSNYYAGNNSSADTG
jgi:hypothetical protein